MYLVFERVHDSVLLSDVWVRNGDSRCGPNKCKHVFSTGYPVPMLCLPPHFFSRVVTIRCKRDPFVV